MAQAQFTVGKVVNPTLVPATNIGGYKASSGVAAPTPYTQIGGVNGSTAATWSTAPQSAPVSNNTPAPAPNNTFDNSNGGAGGGGGGSSYDPAAAAAAAAAAANAARAAAARGQITNLAHSILSVYDGLYGSLDTAAADQSNQVNQKFDSETNGLTDQYNTDFPTIGNSYSARGAFDSSYRQDAEGNATKAFNNQVDQERIGREGELSAVGQKRAEGRAAIDANKGGVNAILDQINQTQDANELVQIQNQIQQKLLDAQAQGASLGTGGGYRSQLAAVAPTTAQTASLQANLSSIIKGQAPSLLKRSVGAKLVEASGLPQDQKDRILASFNSQLPDDKLQG